MMTRMLAVLLLCLVCVDAAMAASSRRVDVMRSGEWASVPLPAASAGIAAARPSSAAFCSANPDVLISFLENVSVSPALASYPRLTSATVTIEVVVDAVCEPGGAALSFNYGALPSSTAASGTDYSGNPLLRFDFPLVPEFGSASATRSVTLSFPDTTTLTATRLDIGFLDAVIVLGPGSPGAQVVRLFSDGAVLLSLVIDGISTAGIVDDLVNAGGTLDPVAEAAIAPLAEHCVSTTDAEVVEQCDAILALAQQDRVDDLVQVLRAISGEELSAQITTSIDTANQRAAQINGRIAALRGGATGISLEDVAFNYRGFRLPLSAMLKAAAGQDEKGQETIGGGLLDQRLGAFLNVTALGGDRADADFEVGFKFEGYSVLAGVDWRFNDRFIAGAAIGWSDLSSKLRQDAGRLDSEGWSLTTYGTWLINERAYLDFSLGRLRNDYLQHRVVDLRPLGSGFSRDVAVGRTEAGQTSIGLGGGVDFAWGEWSYSPRGSVLLTRSDVDGFVETGSGINDLIFEDQSFDSLVWTFSQSVSRSFSIGAGALQPYLTIDLSRELRNEAFVLTPRLRIRPDLPSTPIQIDASDRWYGRYDLGASFVGANGLQWFLSYSRLFGFAKVQAWAVRGGLRLEF